MCVCSSERAERCLEVGLLLQETDAAACVEVKDLNSEFGGQPRCAAHFSSVCPELRKDI